MAMPDGWAGKRFQITLERASSSTYGDHTAEITDVRIKPGERTIESEPVFGGGRIAKKSSRADHEIEFDFITTDASLIQRIIGGTDTSQPITVSLDADPTRQRIIMTATNGVAQLRYYFANALGASVDQDVSGDGYMKGTMKFVCPVATSGGTNNAYIESTSDSNVATLTALSPALGSFV